MNKVMLVARLCRDPEVRYPQGENASAIARFSVAVNRHFKNNEGNYDADFINCVAFGKTAEFIEKYFKKGMAIGISGRIQTGSYTNKDSVKVYTNDVVVEEAEFVESKNSDASTKQSNTYTNNNQSSDSRFIKVPDTDMEEFPFN